MARREVKFLDPSQTSESESICQRCFHWITHVAPKDSSHSGPLRWITVLTRMSAAKRDTCTRSVLLCTELPAQLHRNLPGRAPGGSAAKLVSTRTSFVTSVVPCPCGDPRIRAGLWDKSRLDLGTTAIFDPQQPIKTAEDPRAGGSPLMAAGRRWYEGRTRNLEVGATGGY